MTKKLKALTALPLFKKISYNHISRIASITLINNLNLVYKILITRGLRQRQIQNCFAGVDSISNAFLFRQLDKVLISSLIFAIFIASILICAFVVAFVVASYFAFALLWTNSIAL
jgi:hypothetical protein